MGNSIEVRYNKWLMAVCYTGSLVLIAGGIFNLYNGYVGDFEGLPVPLQWFLTITAVVGIIAGVLLLLHFRKFRVLFKPDEIRIMGLMNSRLAYEDISKIHVGKSHVEIRGDSLFRRVSIGNLNTNFEAAVDRLASRVVPLDEIEFGGKEEYIERYFTGTGDR